MFPLKQCKQRNNLFLSPRSVQCTARAEAETGATAAAGAARKAVPRADPAPAPRW